MSTPRRAHNCGRPRAAFGRSERQEAGGGKPESEGGNRRRQCPTLRLMESLPLIIGIGAVILVGFWIVKKLFKLAMYAAVIGAIAWVWFFVIN